VYEAILRPSDETNNMLPNAEFLLLFANLADIDSGEESDELLGEMAEIVAMTASEAAELGLAATKYHLNQNDMRGKRANDAAASFAKLIVQHGHEYKSTHGDGFDVTALVKSIDGML